MFAANIRSSAASSSFSKRSEVRHDRGIDDEHVDASVRGVRTIGQDLDFGGYRDVTGDRSRLPAGHLYFGDHPFARFQIAARHDDPGSRLRHAQGDRPPDAARRASHQRNLALQRERPVHL